MTDLAVTGRPDAPASSWTSRDLSPRDARIGIAVAIALGVLVRALPVLRHDFPLNDGGFFYQLAREIQLAHFRLPAFSTYNGERIPFAYPPLGFYLTAALTTVLPMSVIGALRWIPLLATCLMLPAFVRLARALLPTRAMVVTATFAFALLPRSYVWLIMGGGLTRSLGMLFSILALWTAHALFTRGGTRALLATALFAACTVLSHLGTAPFLAASLALFWLAWGRSMRGTVNAAFVALLTIVLTAPWWGTVIARHGLAPFLAAQATGGSVLSGVDARWSIRLLLLRFGLGLTSEPLFPAIYVLAVLGAIRALAERRWVLPAWWLIIMLADVRAPGTYASLPIALLAGAGVTDVLIPLLSPGTPPAASGTRPRRAASMVLVLLVLYTLGSSFVRDYDYLPTDLPSLASLTPADRNAMRWMARATPPDSRVLVVSDAPWPADRWSEWFPVIAGRRSVATVQGTEWLPGHAFARRERASVALAPCARQDVTCLTRWSDSTGIAFTHVFVSRAARAPGALVERCCDRLQAALEADAMWVRVFDGPGAAIFERRALAAAPNAQLLSARAVSSRTVSASVRSAGVSR